MSDETNDMPPEGPANSQFDQLVRLILHRRASGALMPNPESVVAYIAGTATGAQTEEVERALADSSDFQHLYLDLIASIQEEPTVEERESFTAMHVPRLDLVEQALRHSREVRNRDRRQSHWRRFLGGISLQVWVPAAAAAAALIMLVANPSLQFWRLPESMSMQMELDQAYFAGDVIRGEPKPIEHKVDTSAQDAALTEFKHVLTLDYTAAPPRYVLNLGDSLATTELGESIKIIMVDNHNEELQTVTVRLPSEYGNSKQTALTAWVLSIPDLGVWRYELSSESERLTSPLKIGLTGLLTVTYPVAGGFRAMPAASLREAE